jgi:hypothetical protein
MAHGEKLRPKRHFAGVCPEDRNQTVWQPLRALMNGPVTVPFPLSAKLRLVES